MESLTVNPIAHVDGVVNLPGSKSISNRLLLLAAQATGKTILNNFPSGTDVLCMLRSLNRLGVRHSLSDDGRRCEIWGLGHHFNSAGGVELFTGNAGTVTRFLTAATCLRNGETTITGDLRMEKRPIGGLVDALVQGGAEIHFLREVNFPPLLIRKRYVGGDVTLNGQISSQFLSAILLMAPLAAEDSCIHVDGDIVSLPYINLTLDAMRKFGVNVDNLHYRTFYIKGNSRYISPGEYTIEPDLSSASYFLAAAAIKGGTILVPNVGSKSLQADLNLVDVLGKMGADVELGEDFVRCARGELTAVDMDMNHLPDAAMTISVVALFAEGITIIRNVHNWRVKETDRLRVISHLLRRLGAEISEGNDYLLIVPPGKLREINVETQNDHRIAMCFSLVALAGVSVTILNHRCVGKTFPGFFETLSKVSRRR